MIIYVMTVYVLMQELNIVLIRFISDSPSFTLTG